RPAVECVIAEKFTPAILESPVNRRLQVERAVVGPIDAPQAALWIEGSKRRPVQRFPVGRKDGGVKGVDVSGAAHDGPAAPRGGEFMPFGVVLQAAPQAPVVNRPIAKPEIEISSAVVFHDEDE